MCQRLIPTGERSGLQTRIGDDQKRFVVRADEKLTAFLEIKSATRGSPSFTHPCTASDTVQAQKRTTKVS